tara:strand:+ start:627 stop:1139 length:513 start_codon:yes stop_codon:yes gene_type:complete
MRELTSYERRVIDGMKICKTCGESKPVHEYYSASTSIDNCVPDCKQCSRKKFRSYAQNKRETDREHYIYTAAYHNAKARGIEFCITVEDIVIPDVCPYIGTKLIPGATKKTHNRRNIPSLDRIDNTIGYVPGNVEVVSWMANLMKGDASPIELLDFAIEVVKKYKGLVGL